MPALDPSADGYRRRRALREALDAGARRMMSQPARSRLHPPVARYVNRAHGEDLAWLAAEYGIRFAALQGDDGELTPPTLSDPPHLAELVVPPPAQALAHLLNRPLAG